MVNVRIIRLSQKREIVSRNIHTTYKEYTDFEGIASILETINAKNEFYPIKVDAKL